MSLAVGIGISPVFGGSVWSPAQLGSDLIAWYSAKRSSSVILNGVDVVFVDNDLINEDFSGGALPSGWSEPSGSVGISYAGGKAIVAQTTLDHTLTIRSPTYTTNNEIWSQVDVTFNSWSLSAGVLAAVFIQTGTGNPLDMQVIESSGNLFWRTVYRDDSGGHATNYISKPAIVLGQTYVVTMRHVKSVAAGIDQVWIDGELFLDVSGLANNTINSSIFVDMGSMFGSIDALNVSFDNVRVGTSGFAQVPELVDEDFTTDPGWTALYGSPVVSGGVFTVDQNPDNEGSQSPTFTVPTEIWFSVDITLVAETSSSGNETIISRLIGSTDVPYDLVLRNSSGNIQFQSRYKTNAGVTSVNHTGKNLTVGQTVNIVVQAVKDASAGLYRMWVDGDILLEVTGLANDTLTFPNKIILASVFGSFTRMKLSFDNVKVGTTGFTPNAVAEWQDLSGNSNHVNNTVAVDQPLLDVANKKITFDGVSDFLQSNSFTGGNLTQPSSVFIVAQRSLNQGQYLFDGISVSNRNSLRQQATAGNMFLFSGTDTDSLYVSNANKEIHSVLTNGVSSEYWVDGVSKNTSNTGTQVLSGLTLGSRYDGTTFYGGDIFEVLVVNKALSTAEHNQLGHYLAARHGLTWTDI